MLTEEQQQQANNNLVVCFPFHLIPYFRSVFACKKCKCLIHKSIQTLAYVRKFTYLSATKYVKQ